MYHINKKVDNDYNKNKAILTYSTKPVPYKLAIKTDATGNQTVAEQISADFEKDSEREGYTFNYNFTINSVLYQIYEQKYLGFEVGLKWNDPFDSNDRTRLIRKRKSENDLILMDEPTTEGI